MIANLSSSALDLTKNRNFYITAQTGKQTGHGPILHINPEEVNRCITLSKLLLTPFLEVKPKSERLGMHPARTEGNQLGKKDIKVLKLQGPMQRRMRSKGSDPVHRQRGTRRQARG